MISIYILVKNGSCATSQHKLAQKGYRGHVARKLKRAKKTHSTHTAKRESRPPGDRFPRTIKVLYGAQHFALYAKTWARCPKNSSESGTFLAFLNRFVETFQKSGPVTLRDVWRPIQRFLRRSLILSILFAPVKGFWSFWRVKFKLFTNSMYFTL